MELNAGHEILERKPCTELCVNGSFTEDRGGWEKELLRHCAGVFCGSRRDRRGAGKRIMKEKSEGDRHFTEDGMVAEIIN